LKSWTDDEGVAYALSVDNGKIKSTQGKSVAEVY
jgi:hypothetical protein